MVIKEIGLENHYPKFGSKVFFKNLQNPSSKSHKWWKMGQNRVLSKIRVHCFKFTLRDRGELNPRTRRSTLTNSANAELLSRTRRSGDSSLRERAKGSANAKTVRSVFRDRGPPFANAENKKEMTDSREMTANQVQNSTPNGPSEFVRNPVNTNLICTPTKFDVPDSMEPSEFGFEVSLTRNPMTHP